jgi:L-seryl-tRNA(Ser) seleniumtransferase
VALDDPRRLIPRTDQLLALPPVRRALERLSEDVVRALVRETQDRARRGEIAPGEVEPAVLAALGARSASSLTPVLNATGVVVHTNLGRAPLSAAALDALVTAGGYVDVELDLVSGTRSRRGAAARAALLAACPPAEDALVVNNGAAALVLATTALAAGREVVISRGELVEIGAGFRLPELIESTGARLREVGTTNRTHLRDYAEAIGPETGCLLKVHPSNFRLEGFTSAVEVDELRPLARAHGLPLVADLGSGLLVPDPQLPSEPDAASALEGGADLVIASGDKLLGGPQAGLLLGGSDAVARLAAHPLARAVRADKLALAALEATLTGGPAPVTTALHADPDRLRDRAERLGAAVGAPVVAHDGRVGGGGAPGMPLPGWAVRLPEAAAPLLRTGRPAVLPRVHDRACLVDLRCVPESEDERLRAAVQAALTALAGADGGPGGAR